MNVRNQSIYVFFILIFFILNQSYGQSIQSKKDVNTDRIERIDGVINNSIQEGEIPGAVVIVAKDGKIVYHKSYGYSNIEKKIPMERNSIFRIASMTKAITTV